MGRSPSSAGDKMLEHHTEAIMELSQALKKMDVDLTAVQEVIKSSTQNPLTLAKIIALLLKLLEEKTKTATDAMEAARSHVQVAEAIRLEESPRRIAALAREAKKRE